MNSEMTDLAREATTADGYHLMRGMTLTDGEITVLVTHRLFDCRDIPTGFWETEPIEGQMVPRSPLTIHEDDEWWPVLDDAATVGCLLHLVRESLNLFGVSTHYIFDPPHMCFQVRNPVEVYSYAVRKVGIGEHTEKEAREIMKVLEVEALVAALKAGGGR